MQDEERARHGEIIFSIGNGGSLSHASVLEAMAKAAAEARQNTLKEALGIVERRGHDIYACEIIRARLTEENTEHTRTFMSQADDVRGILSIPEDTWRDVPVTAGMLFDALGRAERFPRDADNAHTAEFRISCKIERAARAKA